MLQLRSRVAGFAGLLCLGGQHGAFFAVEQPMQPGREHTSHQRRHDEQPYLTECGAADDPASDFPRSTRRRAWLT